MYLIGYILKPQGIKGEIKVKSISPYPERFQRLEKVFIRLDGIQPYNIENVRLSGEFVFLKLIDVNDRNSAGKFRGCEILIDKSELIELKDDEFFVHDLVGCKVYSENEQYIGELVQIMQAGSNDVYTVKDESGKSHFHTYQKALIGIGIIFGITGIWFWVSARKLYKTAISGQLPEKG